MRRFRAEVPLRDRRIPHPQDRFLRPIRRRGVLLPAARDRCRGAAVLAEALRIAIAERELVFNAENIRVTVSLGVAEVTSGVDQPAQLIRRADEALYRAKETGRNRVVVHSEMASA